MAEPRHPVITLMFDARIQAMTNELRQMEAGELDRDGLKGLHAETRRLLQLPDCHEDTTA